MLIYNAFILFIAAASTASAQVSDSSGTLPEKAITGTPLEKAVKVLEQQLSQRPQEKVYLHFDKPYYAAGDDIWFRAYLVNAATHVPSDLSRIIYVELIGPADTIVQRLALKKDQGNFNGSFQLSDALPGGHYRVRAYTSWMRNFGEEFFFRKNIMIGNSLLSNLQARIEYEVDRDSSPPEITALIRFLDGNGKPAAGREVSYEHVLIGKPKSLKTATTNEQGIIRISVPYNESSLYPNKYIRTSINFDGLPFVKDFFLPSFKVDTDLRFFPEGGELIAGVPNIVAFKAIDASGLGVGVKGVIRDEEGKKITEFESVHRGMGKFVLTPLPGQDYTAGISLPGGGTREYPLPEVQEEGYLLTIRPADSVIRVSIAASSARLRNRPVFLLGESRGQPYYAAQAVLEKSLYQASVPIADFPGGIARFTLFDMAGIPVAERLVFIPPRDQLDISIRPDQAVYGAREKVQLQVQVKDASGKPVKGEFSISITDASVVDSNTVPGILAGLLLNGDLKGYIEDPAWYFNPASGERQAALDLLMLTQGWRRFEWKNILDGRLQEIAYPLELGFETLGRVYSDSGDPLPHARVIMLAGDRKEGFAAEDTADAAGRFRFSGYEFPDSTRVLIQARNEKGRRFGEIEIQEDWPRVHFQRERFPPNIRDSMDAYLALSKEAFTIEREKLGLTSILLDPVEVVAQEKAPNSTGLHSYADNIITAEDITRMGSPSSIYDILRGRVPGLQVIGNRIVIRGINTFYGNTDPLVVVDGVRSMDAGILGMINPYDVASIEILKGPNAAIYGMGAANGVIVINTKRGEYEPRGAYERRGVISFFPQGYHVAREFYVPKYNVPKNLRDKTPDLRSTIYWNGDVRTGSDGSASLSFYAADRPAPYMVIMEGISADGKPGQVKTFLKRE
ncbi:TonB-dependent SusC/RagA subfamily outer membrane receptor [Anseongella ginsenosidimutans]|uniref:TonB-dependent SusC/RagA subfamily outer membrane receptor n=1 Tax=Anseongella ginsenosidimutans TaxID=496056 RepID=A0A4R3L0I5_9SPHI|nr:TonB-dependent SusC/RagA subfamily outer membrane receptor [Anseongella ginsenosidimutans]